jgi:hypothetical protein
MAKTEKKKKGRGEKLKQQGAPEGHGGSKALLSLTRSHIT